MGKRIGSLSVFFLLFALSGFSGLIYESIWTHYLKLFLGHAAYAQTLVLAIFMGGMALGSWVCSAYSLRWKNLLLGYALAEGVIGLLALVFHPLFVGLLDVSYDVIIPQLGGPVPVNAFKWGLSALLILPQSVLLGMAFPLMSAGIVRRFPERPGRSVALLYFTNSIGAAIGVLAGGFLLIKLLGLPGTISLAGLINILLALIVWALVRASAGEGAPVTLRSAPASEQSPAAGYRFFLLASLVTGAASFIYEVGWIRMLSLVLGSSTHAFELMLSAFILGLAFGGLWIQRRIDALSAPVPFLGKVQVIMGILALSTLLLYGASFEVMQWLVRNVNKTDSGYVLFTLSSSAIALATMLPTTFCAGMTLPLLTLTLMRRGSGEKSIGAVYAANTVGAIFGVFFAVHVGMPGLGLKGLITFGAALDIALGIALFRSAKGEQGRSRAPLAFTAAAAAALLGTLLFVNLDPYKMGSGVYRQGALASSATHRLLYHRDGTTATITSFLSDKGFLSIRTNGKPDASVMVTPGAEHASDESTMVLLAVLPMTFHPQAKTAATIGFGSGYTSHMLLTNPAVSRVDTIEIERNIVEAAQHFRPLVDMVYTDSRSSIYFDDAKTFFSTYNKRYDLIVSEPSNPWVSGVAGLFSTEFYRRVNQHLNDDGLFVQWVQLYDINVDLVFSILKAISRNFEDYAVYASNHSDMLIIAKKKGTLPRPDYSLMKIPPIAAALQRIRILGEQDIAARKIGSKRFFAKLLSASAVPANSDYYPFLDQNAEQARFLGAAASDFASFTHIPLPTIEMLDRSEAQDGPTEITPSPYYGKSHEFYTAMGLRDVFIKGYTDKPIRRTDLLQQAVLLKQSCKGDFTLYNEERLVILFNLSVALSPYLTASELDLFWSSLETGDCMKTASPVERQWHRLLKAVGRRAAGEMLAGARDLLEQQQGLAPLERKYLLAAGMLGALAEGKRAEAGRLWSSYGPAVFGSSEPDLLFRLLVAETAAD